MYFEFKTDSAYLKYQTIHLNHKYKYKLRLVQMSLNCIYCEVTFNDSFELFKHMDSHSASFVIQDKRLERFGLAVVDRLCTRVERFPETVHLFKCLPYLVNAT